MKPWNLVFWTPSQPPPTREGTFGCAVHGWAGAGAWKGPEEPSTITFPRKVQGQVFSGTYDAVALLAIEAARMHRPSAAIALFARADGMEAFLARLQAGVGRLPVTGGGAARRDGVTYGAVLPDAEDVALLLVTRGTCEVGSANLHVRHGPPVEFQHDGPRRITALRFQGETTWHPAAVFYRKLQKESGRPEHDCESLALSDPHGRNVHAAFDGPALATGSDLPDGPLLCLGRTDPHALHKGMEEFCANPSAMVFACAGLRGLLPGPVRTGPGTIAGFMFGEVVSSAQGAGFGNLMLSKLVIS